MSKSGRLTTHVLDTALGRPAHGLKIDLYRLEGDARHLIRTVHTNSDGRVDGPLMEGPGSRPGPTNWSSTPVTILGPRA